MTNLIKAAYRAPTQAIENHLKVAYLLTQKAESEAKDLTESVRKANASKLRVAKRKARRIAEEHGRAEAKRELEAERKRLHASYSEMLRNTKHECLELAISIAHEVISSEISTNPKSLIHRIELVLEDLNQSACASLSLNPKDFEILSSSSPDALQRVTQEISLDETVRRGEAVIEGTSGQVEVSWQTHLTRIAETLRQHLVEQNG